MVENIANLDDHRPHTAQYVACMNCAHDWVVVAPVGVTAGLECSECGEMSGEPVAYNDINWFRRFIDFKMSKKEELKRTLVLLTAKVLREIAEGPLDADKSYVSLLHELRSKARAVLEGEKANDAAT